MIVISGGQVGADRAGLDAAIDQGMVDRAFMGWCPKGRRAIDGTIPEKYAMLECPSTSYPERTRKNIEAADATLILGWGVLKGGTALTVSLCRDIGKPHTYINLSGRVSKEAEKNVARWLRDNEVQVLNVAGPTDIDYERAYRFVWYVLEEL